MSSNAASPQATLQPKPGAWTLWLTPRSPFARRVRLALLRLRLPFQSVETTPLEPKPDFLAMNPLGLVPILVDPEGTRWLDSALILDLFHQKTQGIWSKDSTRALLEHQASNLAQGLMESGVQFYLEGQRPHPDPSWITDHEEVATRVLKELEKPQFFLLLRNEDESLSQPGWDLGIALDYITLRLPHLDWRVRHPRFLPLFEQCLAQKAFQETRPPEFMNR